MTTDQTNSARDQAVDHLTELGLSTYAARTFVALSALGGGTAQDVSDVSEVPRTRVYDAADELADWGLVDVHRSEPKRFRPVSVETASRHLEHEYVTRVRALRSALDSVESVEQTTEQRGVWEVTGRDTVTDRVVAAIEEAQQEVVFMSVEELLSERVTTALRAASDRGVSIHVAGMSEAAEDAVLTEVPDGEPFESMWGWSQTHAGRLLMVDQTRTLASVLVPDDADADVQASGETAIWGSGKTNSLVVVLRAMFTWQLDGDRE